MNEYLGNAFCIVPVAPMRAIAAHRSEMVSQLIYGEACTIIEHADEDWCKITCGYDGYEGWVQKRQLKPGTNDNTVYAREWINPIKSAEGEAIMAPFGSYLPKNTDAAWDPLTAKITDTGIRDIAFTFLNTAYLWGGKSVFGVDCSGFVQTVFRFFNMPLQRDASQQATQGEAIGFLQEARLGDLAFFDNEEGRITHVGLLLNEHEIIHASVKVRVDDIDNYGIVNRETGIRTHKLRLIKRYF